MRRTIRVQKNEVNFEHNGYGILRDVLTCTCTEVLNGQYDIELEYPIGGALIEYLIEENIIKAPVGNPSGEDQLFRIKLISKQLKRIKVSMISLITFLWMFRPLIRTEMQP